MNKWWYGREGCKTYVMSRVVGNDFDSNGLTRAHSDRRGFSSCIGIKVSPNDSVDSGSKVVVGFAKIFSGRGACRHANLNRKRWVTLGGKMSCTVNQLSRCQKGQCGGGSSSVSARRKHGYGRKSKGGGGPRARACTGCFSGWSVKCWWCSSWWCKGSVCYSRVSSVTLSRWDSKDSVFGCNGWFLTSPKDLDVWFGA